MLIELLTPLMLASTPATITLNEQVVYSHESQGQVGDNGPISQVKTFTAGGTQTYNYQGKPYDNDNDSD